MNSNLTELLEVYNLIGTVEYKQLFKALVLGEVLGEISELSAEELEDTNEKLEECYHYYMNSNEYATIFHPKIIEKYLMS